MIPPVTALFCGEGWRYGRGFGIRLSAGQWIQANSLGEVIPALAEVEDRTSRGLVAFGFIAYEAAGAFGLPVHFSHSPKIPLVWFGFCSPNQIERLYLRDLINENPSIMPMVEISLPISADSFSEKIQWIKQFIAQGDTYQINYTLRAGLQSSISGLPLFFHLYRSQPVPFAAFLRTDSWEIHSLSPELFLHKEGEWISSRPMKGTSARGLMPEEDRFHARCLSESEKNRAENIMILDMVRNDLGRLCRPGRVWAEEICRVERYSSLFQMTSLVRGQLQENPGLISILAATFPAASITGAPKHRTMELIRELEEEPRNVYCGSMGIVYPNGDFIFNVAIRTLYGQNGYYTLGAGCGIVWDSHAEEEYKEIENKMAFVQSAIPEFALLETLRLNPDGHYDFLDEHLERLAASAEYWDFPFNRESIQKDLLQFAGEMDRKSMAVRLTLDRNGEIAIAQRLIVNPPDFVRVRFSPIPIDSRNRFFYHKTTHRQRYDIERKEGLEIGFFETLFLNENGHVTEGTVTNLFYRIGDRWYTPPIRDGLLPGIWRADFINQTNATERSIEPAALSRVDEAIVGNSVIGQVVVREIVL